SNTDEMTFFMGNDEPGFTLTEEEMEQRVADLAPADAEQICAHYREAMSSASPSERWIRFFSAYSIALPVWRQARRHADVSSGATWLYRLALPSPALGGRLGSTHTIETPLLFDNPAGSPLLSGSAEAGPTAQAMSTAWAGMAADG